MGIRPQTQLVGYCNSHGTVGWTEIHIKPDGEVIIFFNSTIFDYSDDIKECIHALDDVLFQGRLRDENGLLFYDEVDILEWLKKNGANIDEDQE